MDVCLQECILQDISRVFRVTGEPFRSTGDPVLMKIHQVVEGGSRSALRLGNQIPLFLA